MSVSPYDATQFKDFRRDLATAPAADRPAAKLLEDLPVQVTEGIQLGGTPLAELAMREPREAGGEVTIGAADARDLRCARSVAPPSALLQRKDLQFIRHTQQQVPRRTLTPALLACWNSRSWPCRSRCRVFVVDSLTARLPQVRSAALRNQRGISRCSRGCLVAERQQTFETQQCKNAYSLLSGFLVI